MKAAYDDGDVIVAKLAGNIDRAGKLVRLHADQTNQACACLFDLTCDALAIDDRVALVDGNDVNFDIRPEYSGVRRMAHETVNTGQAVGRDQGAAPLNHIAVVVVARRLDQEYFKSAPAHDIAFGNIALTKREFDTVLSLNLTRFACEFHPVARCVTCFIGISPPLSAICWPLLRWKTFPPSDRPTDAAEVISGCGLESESCAEVNPPDRRIIDDVRRRPMGEYVAGLDDIGAVDKTERLARVVV